MKIVTNSLVRSLAALTLGTAVLFATAASHPAGATSVRLVALGAAQAIYPGNRACPGGCGART
jgi:hypothetical protein